MPSDFFNSAHCKSRGHCVACRTDLAWRKSLQRARLVESAEFECPHGITAETAPAIQVAALDKIRRTPDEQKSNREEQGRAAWAWLHEEAGKEALTAQRLQAEFMPMIPAYGCQCKREWQGILAANPLPTSGQAKWAEDGHNDVNAKLGKPLWPLGVDTNG